MRGKIFIILFVLSIIGNIFLLSRIFSKAEKIDTFSTNTKSYPYLAKRIFLDNANDVIINFTNLRQEIRGYIQKENLDIGLYFQYLPTGVSIGYQQDKPFVAASLLKLPTVMKVEKMLELGEINEDDKITITEDVIDSGYGDLYQKGVGTKLTISELIDKSLIDSDNTAHNSLYKHVVGGAPADVYNNLDIPPHVITNEIAITPRNYASILRSLYFSSYLSYQNSNNVLSKLTEIREGQNLRANIPNEVKIAQKIGVYEKGNSSNDYTYSDCGIYYLPNRQYILCIMVIGEKASSSSHTKNLSNIIYNYMSKINLSK